MNKVLAGVLLAALAALAGSGYLLHSKTKQVGDLNAKVSTLEQSVRDTQAEVGRRDNLATVLDKVQTGLDATKVANQQAFSKVERSIRNIKPSEGDSNESIACLNTPVPAALDSVLRDSATDQPTSGVSGRP